MGADLGFSKAQPGFSPEFIADPLLCIGFDTGYRYNARPFAI